MTLNLTQEIAPVISRARQAQIRWAAMPVRERLAVVERFRTLLVAETERITSVICRELGKVPAEVLGGEILGTADACRFLVRNGESLLRPKRIARSQRPFWLMGQRDEVHRRPRGVVGIIGTWNYPLFLNGVQIMQALAAGNAVVWKPSEVAPETAALIRDLTERASPPVDLFHALPATRDMGAVLSEADVDHVVFTGSANVGRKLAARLGERLISSTLELSGCDAQFVLEGADPQLAARAAWFGSTVNRGQTCIAVRRAFVHRSLYPTFSAALATLAESAPPVQLTMDGQQKQAERLLQDAVAAGGRLVGGPGPGGLRPGVIFDARPEMALCQEAAFAPVMAVLPFDTLDDALAMEARCPYALGASIYAREPDAAENLAPRLRAGVVTVNDVVMPTAHPATPFGGRGASGWGVTQGAEGLLEMTVPQVVSVKSGTFRPHYDTQPEKIAFSERLLRAILQASHGPTLGSRLGGWLRVIRTMMRGK